MTPPTTTLPSGDELPMVGIGTWDIDGDTVRDSVRAGLDAGYGHVDTAEGYRNESEIGDALADYDREDVFLTSKVLAKNLDYESVLDSCRQSLERLGTDYLDLYLIHWPNPAISLRETLNAMATLHEEGKVKNVGVSNFSAYQLSCAQHVSDVPIAVNQIEYHPWNTQDDVVEHCRETDTVVEAAAPLGRTEVFEDETVQEIAEDYEKSPPQIILKWAVENDVVVLPKSSSPDHVRSNLDLFEWSLDEEDKERIGAIEREKVVYDFPARDWSGDTYGISE
ncbi:aldo/keto reductase family oxidoreductase [Halogeometricum pallidum JCM 14848]|uniref:Aldo/keto reductase family oxidoreductase n=1 Tax=Halogeometricum pallidum JCM 14848 TaxID=1227487 RepID=M0D1G0_HALPD|nr:aldo/keto reductase [Halogeometricum pallidum]ELZ28502.1 aldo/keto reductase family oxidoreductase [Halogeometricum pallidum JCM 14848]